MNNLKYPFIILPSDFAIEQNKIHANLTEEFIIDFFNLKKPQRSFATKLKLPDDFEFKTVKRFKFEYESIPLWLIISFTLIYAFMVVLWVFTPLNENQLIILGIILSIAYLIHGNIIEVEVKVKKDSKTLKEEMDMYLNYNKSYPSEQIRHDKIYESKLLEYQSKLAKYKILYIEYVKKNTINSKGNINREKNLLNRGRSEIILLEKLIELYGNNVIVDHSVEFGATKYIPDFIVKCRSGRFLIDIEIDEPYTKIDSKIIPIHFINSDDEKRNIKFSNNNWLVLRFSENQILNNIENVVSYIKNVVNKIESYENITEQNILFYQDRWTYEEALVMIKNNYRNINLT
jgi:hypothetical protein